MNINFNADEVYEIAEQMERNGAKFYKHASERKENKKYIQLLQKLASMEVEHEKVFASMRRKLTKERDESVAFDPDGQMALYIRAWADGKVFNEIENPIEEIVGKKPGMEDILKAAIGLEQDSILYYLGLKEMTLDEECRKQLDGIIKEEILHIAYLKKELELIK